LNVIPTDVSTQPDIALFLDQRIPLPDSVQQLVWQPYPRGQSNESGYRIWSAPTAVGTFFRLDFTGADSGASFFIDPRGKAIWMCTDPGEQDEQEAWQGVNTLLLGRVMNVALTCYGLLCLHSSVVVVNDRAIAFLGDTGAGKSTLAAALVARGFPLLADDRAVLTEQNGNFIAQPGAPRLRLWPDTLAHLQYDPEQLTRVMLHENKRYLPPEMLSSTDKQPRPAALTLGAIYILGAREKTRATCSSELLTPAAGLYQLLRFRIGASVRSRIEQTDDYARLARLAQVTPVRYLHRIDDLAAVRQLADVILNDCAAYAN
jgi:hypothetical protein